MKSAWFDCRLLGLSKNLYDALALYDHHKKKETS